MDYKYVNFWNKNSIHQGVGMTEISHGTLKFFSTDSYDNFKKNPKPNYTVDSITYTFNYSGFRTMEFIEAKNNGKKNILCMGCSYTLGVGLQNELSWPVKLQEYFPDHNILNLGIAGGSGDAISRLLYITLDFFQPESVFILWPEIARVEDYTTRCNVLSPITVGTWEFDKNIYNYIQGDDHYLNVRRRNLAIVELLQHKYKFKLVNYAANKFASCDNVKDIGNIMNEIYDFRTYDKGRDNHPGPVWHKYATEIFYNEYKRLYLGQ